MSRLTFDDVHKSFGDVPAVAGVSLEIDEGEIFAVIGPSGCGKTTLLRSTCGLETLDRGRILVDDQDVTKKPPEKRGMAMVFQNYALFGHLSVVDNVAFGLGYAGIARRERHGHAMSHLERVGLAHAADRRPAELSGGQQQRVALARSLAVNPSILLLDEPLSNLDARLRESTRDDIRSLLRANGVTALYVTHDQEEAMALADRIAVMRDGRVEQCDTAEALYRRPRTAFVATFVGKANLLEGKVTSGTGEQVEVECQGLRFQALRPTANENAAVTVAVRPEALRLSDEGTHRGTLLSRTFLGPTTTFRLRTESGLELEGLEAGLGGPGLGAMRADRPDPGATVRFDLDPDRSVVVEA